LTQLLQQVSRHRRHLVSCRVATWGPCPPLPLPHSPAPTVTIISPKSTLPCLSRTANNPPLTAPVTKSPARHRHPVPGEDRPLSSAAGRLVSAARFLVPEKTVRSPLVSKGTLPAFFLDHRRWASSTYGDFKSPPYFSSLRHVLDLRASRLAPPKCPPNDIWGRRLGAWLTAWPTVSGTTDALSSPLVSSPASSNGAANGNSFAAAQRAVALQHASAGNECHVARFPLLPAPSPSFSRPVSGYI
jgi:hypothetical protein